MNRTTLALLVAALGAGAFAANCALFKDKPALVYRFHSDAWGESDGHVLTVMASGATRTELERTAEAPALTVDGQVPARHVKRLVEALGLAGFFDMKAACARPASPGEQRRRALTVYRDGKAVSVEDLWSCAPDPELLENLLSVLDEFAVGKRASLDPAPNLGEEERLAAQAEAELAAGAAVVHLNAFGEARGEPSPVLSVALLRNGVAQVSFRRTSPATRRSFVDGRTVRVGVEEFRALRAKAEQLAASDLPRGAAACAATGRSLHLSWPRAKGRGEISVVDDCEATPAVARELARDLVALGERVARPAGGVASR